ncbi:MAG: hypothetical protein JWN70_1920 [Planctomycetaceae bacterium]|nr:hypothetical protein [Planctomycetaceae bacterium]
MSLRTRWCRTLTAAALAICLTTGIPFLASPPTVAVAEDAAATKPIEKGLRVYSAGHSFHVFVPGQLAQMAKAAGIKDHVLVGLSSIGGSRVIQHWDVADDKFKSKEVLKSGKADVLTLAPIHLPDDGIEKFATLALEGNPNIRVTIEEFWLPFDIYDTTFKQRPAKVDHNAPTADDLRKLHAPYFKSMDEHVVELNKKFGKQVLFVVPAGQAIIALREKIIAGQVPGLKQQEDLFTDPIGHATAPLQLLVSYCHFAVIYQRSPVGLPMPQALAAAKKPEWDDKLNLLLQELAWEAVTQHPLSGVKVAAAK